MSSAEPAFTIPDDLQACQALVEQLAGTIGELNRRNEELKLAYKELLQQAFRRRSERYINDPNQMKLDFGASDDVADAVEGLSQAVEEAAVEEPGVVVKEHVRRPRKPRNGPFPEHIERYEVVVELPDAMKDCLEHGERTLLGYDRVERLEFKRPEIRVRVTKYPKYICEGSPECGVVSPQRPTGLVDGDRYDTSVAAEVLTGKYGYHLPIYRLQDYFAGSGWLPSRSTLLNLLVASAFVIRPLIEHFKQSVLEDSVIGTDDTPLTLLLPKNIPKPDANDAKAQRIYEVFTRAVANGKPSVPARMWAYRGVSVPLNVFDLSSTPRNPNLLSLNDLRTRDLGVAPGAVVWGRAEWHGYGASICCTVGGSATPVAANTLPQVPWASLRNRNRLPSCSTWAYCRLTRSRITSSHSNL